MRKMQLKKLPFARLMIVLALFVAMASSGLAHRFTSGADTESLNAYLAAGGTYADICADDGMGGHSAGQTCDACRLVDSAALPFVAASCAATHAVILAANAAFLALPPSAFAPDPSRPVRAPPVV
jgi:hypothetical protein